MRKSGLGRGPSEQDREEGVGWRVGHVRRVRAMLRKDRQVPPRGEHPEMLGLHSLPSAESDRRRYTEGRGQNSRLHTDFGGIPDPKDAAVIAQRRAAGDFFSSEVKCK